MYGEFIRNVRRSRRLSQVQLAQIVGINQPNLSAYENDRQVPSADTLNKILVGCGYLLEAVSGNRRIQCPLPRAGWFPDEEYPSDDAARPVVEVASIMGDGTEGRDPETRALHIEQVLALADALRESKAVS